MADDGSGGFFLCGCGLEFSDLCVDCMKQFAKILTNDRNEQMMVYRLEG